MATYNITKSDGNPGPAIADAASPDTQTDLQLVGQNAVSYGLDVATSFYWLLENFAATTAPTTGSLGRATGQLWYDKTTSSETLNVYNGATWDQIANTNRGAGATSGTLRWDNATNTWTESLRVTVTAAGALGIIGPTPGNSVSFTHDDTDLNVVGVSTVDINVTGVTAVNMPSITLTTALDETYGGTGQTVYAVGDIMYASTTTALSKLNVGSNGDVLTLAAGVPSWVAGSAGVSALNDLSDVTLTTPANNSLLYRSAGVYIDSNIANLSFDGTSLEATQIAGIAKANLVDKSAGETIAGAWIFSNAAPINATGGDILASSGNGLSASNGAGAIAIRHDATDVNFTHSSTTDWNITGLTAVRLGATLYSGIAGGTAGQIKVLGTANTNSTNEGFVSVNHNDDGQQQIRMGTRSGSSFSEVNALVDDLNLYAANTLVANIDPTTTTWTQNTITALVLRNAFTTGANATTSATVGDHNAVQYNVGYNETPTEASVGANINTGSFNLGGISIGKMISRTTSTSRSVTLVADTDIPVGGSVLIHNGASGGTLTIIPFAGQTLTWVDGSGSVPASATRTLAYNSICTVRKVNSTTWQIWGNGIS